MTRSMDELGLGAESGATAGTEAGLEGAGRPSPARIGGKVSVGDAMTAAAPHPGEAHAADFTDRRIRSGALVRWGFLTGLGLVAALMTAAAIYTVKDMLIRVVVALFIAVSLDPAVRWLADKGMRRGTAVGLIVFLFVGAIVAFLISVIPPLIAQLGTLGHDLPTYIDRLQHGPGQASELIRRFGLSSRIQGALQAAPNVLGGGILGITSRVLGAFVSLLTVVVLTIYFLLELPNLRRGIVRVFPMERRQRYGEVVDVVVNKVGDYMIGRLIIGVVAGVVSFLALIILHVPFFVPLALFIALIDLIPLIGHPIGTVAAIVVAAFTVPIIPNTLVLLLVFLAYQQLENYLIGPRVLKGAVDLSAAAVLLSALIGTAALGLVGALIAIPVAAAVKVVLIKEIETRETAHRVRTRRLHPRFPRGRGRE